MPTRRQSFKLFDEQGIKELNTCSKTHNLHLAEQLLISLKVQSTSMDGS